MYKPTPRVRLKCGPSLTEQSHAAQVKIKNIMKRAQKTGVIDHVNRYEGTYMEMPDELTFHEAQNMIAHAKTMFESVPAAIRADFDNNPAHYIEFMQNPSNREKIEAYGLDASHLPEPPPPSPPPAPAEPEE